MLAGNYRRNIEWTTMQKYLFGPFVCLLASTVFAQAPQTAPQAAPQMTAATQPTGNGTVVETIIARINSEIITLGELARQREVLRQELQQRYQGVQLQSELSAQE